MQETFIGMGELSKADLLILIEGRCVMTPFIEINSMIGISLEYFYVVSEFKD